MTDLMNGIFIHLTWGNALLVSLLGLIGGILSGFTGSGGAFFMTPGMMNLHVPGVVAVGSNVAHRLGNNMVGALKHAKFGNVDKRLAIFMLVTDLIAVRIAVVINSFLFSSSGEGHGEGGGGAASDLYISVVFISVLTFVGAFMLRDAVREARSTEGSGPSAGAAAFFAKLKLPPYIYFPVADVKISLWLLLGVGLAIGYLDGTVAIGGFVGVPAMIYLFGVPTSVATGTELYLAMFGGGLAAFSYAYKGLVDLRLTFLLLTGSIIGVYIGAYGTKVLREVFIRLVAGSIILLCVISRAVAVPVYLRELKLLSFDQAWEPWLKGASTAILFAAGIGGALFILVNVVRAHAERRRVQETLKVTRPIEA